LTHFPFPRSQRGGGCRGTAGSPHPPRGHPLFPKRKLPRCNVGDAPVPSGACFGGQIWGGVAAGGDAGAAVARAAAAEDGGMLQGCAAKGKEKSRGLRRAIRRDGRRSEPRRLPARPGAAAGSRHCRRVTGFGAEPRFGNSTEAGSEREDFSGRRQEPGWRGPSAAAALALGGFRDEAERVQRRGRCWILSLAPHPPRPVAPPAAPSGPVGGDRGRWDTLGHPTGPKMTRHPQICPLRPDNSLSEGCSGPPEAQSLSGVQRGGLRTHPAPATPFAGENGGFLTALHCPVRAGFFRGSSAWPWAEPRISGVAVPLYGGPGWGASAAPGPPGSLSRQRSDGL